MPASDAGLDQLQNLRANPTGTTLAIKSLKNELG